MPGLIVETEINAPVEVCFDLARNISLHCETAENTHEKAIAGVTHGLIGLGESVTFEGVHFGIRQRLTAKVTEFDAPRRFVDEMTRGAFKSLKHIHEFIPITDGTLMKDTIIWTSPFGLFGKLADNLFIHQHLKNFLLQRNLKLKAVAENI